MRILSRLLPLALLALAPLPCRAEGAVQIWTCSERARCPEPEAADDACRATAPAPHLFRIAAAKTDAEGRGRYRIDHNGTAFEGDGAGFTGPFDWREGGTAHALAARALPDDRVRFDLTVTPPAGSDAPFRIQLDCEVTQ